jgi:hypothetical protein
MTTGRDAASSDGADSSEVSEYPVGLLKAKGW